MERMNILNDYFQALFNNLPDDLDDEGKKKTVKFMVNNLLDYVKVELERL